MPTTTCTSLWRDACYNCAGRFSPPNLMTVDWGGGEITENFSRVFDGVITPLKWAYVAEFLVSF
eukprot:SAG11_NODE_8123_length_1058_cov_1.077164_1_plen_64_part_00